MIKRLFFQFPKWFLAGSIILLSTALFVIWWYFWRTDDQPEYQVIDPLVETPPPTDSPPEGDPMPDIAISDTTRPKSKPKPKPVKRASSQQHRATVDLADKITLLGGKDLYEFRESTLQLLQADWLSRELELGEQPAFLKDHDLVAVSGAGRSVEVFAPDGQSLGRLTLSNGERFDGYVADAFTQAVFVKGGDLWKGQIDWPNVKIAGETQVTTLGYFQSSQFQDRLIGATAYGLVYRDVRYGNISVDLTTGEAEPVQLPANATRSPTGRLIVGDVPTPPAQLAVFDVNARKYSTHPIPWRIPQNGLAWLDETRFALILGNEVYLYEHETQSLTSIYRSEAQQARLQLVAIPVFGQPYVMFQDTSKGILVLNVETKETHPVTGPPATSIQMLNNGAFLLSSDVPNSEQRGTWLGKYGEPDLSRVFAQPLTGRFDGNQAMAFAIPETDAALVKAFDQWHTLQIDSGELSDSPLTYRRVIPITNR